jgi:hypothetical protein
MADIIKACPFCGSTTAPALLRGDEITECDENEHSDSWAMVCDAHDGGCGAAAGYHVNPDSAVHKWNDRAELGVRLARVKGERIFLKDLDLRALLSRFVLCEKEPAMYVYRINGVYDGISNTLPPNDAYDEGTLQPLYSPAMAAGIRLAHPFDEDVERAAFERWSKDAFIHFTDVSGVYELADTRNAWAAWLARARLADIGKEGGEGVDAMKLCPLFESIQMPYRQRLEPPASFYDGMVAANAKLPREAIEAAIVAIEDAASCIRSVVEREHYDTYIEQLRALIPQDHADLTAHDSELHGIHKSRRIDE